MSETFLENVVVVELGGRLSVGLCGALLQRLGAEVWVVDQPLEEARPDSKAAHRQLLGAGKHLGVPASPDAGADYLKRLVERANVVITSSDWQGDPGAELRALLETVPVVCDVSAFGSSGPLAGLPYTDGMVQAFAGLVDTTGTPDGVPVASRVPVAECTAAVFAAAGVVAALRSRRRSMRPHRVEVALFDTAVSMLSTFLPAHFTGGSPRRMGNRHPSMSPWNAYAAQDGWVLVCSASDEMWGRLCEVIGRPELKTDSRFRRMVGRVENAAEADAALEPWIARHTIVECLNALNAASVPCGPVLTIADVLAEPSLKTRGSIRELCVPGRPAILRVPGALVHGTPAAGRPPEATMRMADPGELPPSRSRAGAVMPSPDGDILAGVRVVEMGNYTTAPLAARNLGALGAYVVKAEPPSGELSRASPPHRDGQSYFCTLSNSDKRSVAVDLRVHEGRKVFRDLLAHADVFIENMKPGALARFGFGPEEIARLNPRLVYCSVSGYGANSPLADRTAMDTTIQGTAGLMDLTRGGDVPYKIGISISDLLGGQFALLATLAGLEYRERTGRGQAIDLSMQELSAWLTQFSWNSLEGEPTGRICACRDGYVYAEGAESSDESGTRQLTRAQAVEFFRARGVMSAPVNTVSEVARHPQTGARDLIVERPSRNGTMWPLLASPIRITPHSPAVRRALGGVGEDFSEVSADWGLA